MFFTIIFACLKRVQALLDAIQCGQQAPDRVSFAPVGTEADGYTSSVLHTTAGPPSGAAGLLHSNSAVRSRGTYTHLRVGEVLNLQYLHVSVVKSRF